MELLWYALVWGKQYPFKQGDRVLFLIHSADVSTGRERVHLPLHCLELKKKI